MRHIESAHLPDTQRVFELEDSSYCRVTITRQEREAAAHDLAAAAYLALKVSVCACDAKGAVLVVDGAPLEPPAKVEAILLSALAEAQLTIASELARCTTEAVQRLRLYLAARAAWQSIPGDGGGQTAASH